MPRARLSSFDAMLAFARDLANVEEGTSCTQTSFKVGGKAFLYLGDQGGRHKAMMKLDASLEDAIDLSESHPDDYQVGSTKWVTIRFAEGGNVPKRRWSKWIKESYALAGG